MAKVVGYSKVTVHCIWRHSNLKPHLIKTFKLPNDSLFVKRLADVVGLYRNPPEQALVLLRDEISQSPAICRMQNSLPIYPGRLGTMTRADPRREAPRRHDAVCGA